MIIPLIYGLTAGLAMGLPYLLTSSTGDATAHGIAAFVSCAIALLLANAVTRALLQDAAIRLQLIVPEPGAGTTSETSPHAASHRIMLHSSPHPCCSYRSWPQPSSQQQSTSPPPSTQTCISRHTSISTCS